MKKFGVFSLFIKSDANKSQDIVYLCTHRFNLHCAYWKP